MTDAAIPPDAAEGKGSKRGKAHKAAIDWEAIERDYRAGLLTNRQIAAKYGNVSHVAIGNRAKREKWEKDLTAKVANRVKSALIAIGIDGEPAGGNADTGNAQERKAAETRTVEEAARTVVEVVRSHRKDVAKAHGIVGSLMAQLNDAMECRESLRDLIEDETAGDRSPNRRIAMLKAVSIPAHAGTIRDLSTAMHKLVQLERQAFNIAELTTPEPDPAPEPEKSPEQDDPALHVTLLRLSTITGVPIPDVPAPDAPAPDQPAPGG